MALARPATRQQQAATALSRSSTSSSGLTLGEALERWYVHLAASERIGSARTITTYRYGVGKLVTHCGAMTSLETITAEGVEGLLASLKQTGMTPGGRAVVYRPIRTFFRWCVQRGLLPSNPVESIAVPRSPASPVKFVTDDEWAAILTTTNTKSRWAFRARRDRAILLLMASVGVRLSEVAGLKVGDISPDGLSVLIHGKGGKDRVVPVLPDAMEALQAYLTLERPRSPFSGTTDALWLGPKGSLTASGIAQLANERGKLAGLKRRVHPHEFRHRFAAQALAAGMPGPLLMQLAGWSSPAMLARYGAHTRSEDAIAFLRGLHPREG